MTNAALTGHLSVDCFVSLVGAPANRIAITTILLLTYAITAARHCSAEFNGLAPVMDEKLKSKVTRVGLKRAPDG